MTTLEGNECPICYEEFDDDDQVCLTIDPVKQEDDEDDEEMGRSKKPSAATATATATAKRTPRQKLNVIGCQHTFCRECLTNHCRYSISVRDIPISCPAKASDQCTNTLQEKQVQDILLNQNQNQCPVDENGKEIIAINNEATTRTTTTPEKDDTGTSNALSGSASTISTTVSVSSTSSSAEKGLSAKPSSNDSSPAIKTTTTTSSTPTTTSTASTRTRSSPTTDDSNNDDWIRFKRYNRMVQDPTLVSCTRCSALFTKEEGQEQYKHENGNDTDENDIEAANDDDDDDDKSSNNNHQSKNGNKIKKCNDVACPTCHHKFCIVHGDGHLGQSCDDYQPAEDVDENEKFISRMTKPCSHCRSPIHKESGCDHIICPVCKQDMCFKCGTHEYLTGEKMIRTCEKCQQNFIDHRHIWSYRLTICLTLPLYIPACIVHIIFMSIFTIITCCCCCCFGCGITKNQHDEQGGTNDGDGDDDDRQRRRQSTGHVFKPIRAFRTVFTMIFLPILEIMAQCGCCSCLDDDEGDTTNNDHNGTHAGHTTTSNNV